MDLACRTYAATTESARMPRSRLHRGHETLSCCRVNAGLDRSPVRGDLARLSRTPEGMRRLGLLRGVSPSDYNRAYAISLETRLHAPEGGCRNCPKRRVRRYITDPARGTCDCVRGGM